MEQDQDHEIADRIKLVRDQQKMTQAQFADALQVSRSIIATLESYVRQPSLELIKRVSQKFKISVEYILDGSKKGKKKNKPETRIEIPEKQNTP